MKRANEPEDFRRYAVLFTKIVDGRYALWRRDCDTASDVFRSIFPTIRDHMKYRLKRWQDKRQKTLFGQNVPDHFFLAVG
jgi:hypothetical protein